MKKTNAFLIMGLLLLSILTIIAPVSAGTIHVYSGDDIKAKIEGAVSGDTVYVHAGTYPVNSRIDVTNKNLTIIGDGASTTIINIAGAGTDIYFYMSSGSSKTVNISGITFRGDSSSNPQRLLYFFDNVPDTSMNVNISDCIMDRSSSNSIDLGNFVVATIENCEIKNGSRPINVGICQATINNCLIHHNAQGIYTQSSYGLTVQSCTIDSNSNAGIYIVGVPTTIKNSIITNNSGCGILDSPPITATSTYNNIWNNGGTVDCVSGGTGSISQNPLYETGRLGTYYLSTSSPCVDRGSASAASLGLDGKTTRVDERLDTGIVDLGYHYLSRLEASKHKSLPIAFILKILKLNQN